MTIACSNASGEATREHPAAPVFSVIMPTRNRPTLFRAALASVLAQRGAAFEVIVVNDGSADEHVQAYAAIERELGAGRPVTFLKLPQTTAGHGVSHATNSAARQAKGGFLCFLDDDDTWTDSGHLARAGAMAKQVPDAKLMLFDQVALLNGEPLTCPVWLEDFGARLRAGEQREAIGPAYRVTPDQLLTATGFSHLNTTIVRADLFQLLGGFDEALRWEQDRDFYLRAIDVAGTVLYCPVVIARHNVPDPARVANVTTRTSALDRHLFQLALLHRAAGAAQHAAIRAYARRHRRYALQKAWTAARTWRERWRVASLAMGMPWARP